MKYILLVDIAMIWESMLKQSSTMTDWETPGPHFQNLGYAPSCGRAIFNNKDVVLCMRADYSDTKMRSFDLETHVCTDLGLDAPDPLQTGSLCLSMAPSCTV